MEGSNWVPFVPKMIILDITPKRSSSLDGYYWFISISVSQYPMPVSRRIGERMIPYSKRARVQLRHFECKGFVGCVVACVTA
ncbi:hypothetical protein TNCV_2267761 [Trichonephila clavipes]|nr:hypothetical protein TNCV_2267761 [Trichonephila clavipes]